MATPKEVADAFLAYIFGHCMGRAVYSEGLVDSRSKEEFGAVLKKIDDIWDSSQRGSQFYHFFCQYQAIVIKYYKRGYIIEVAGLSSPLSIKKKKQFS